MSAYTIFKNINTRQNRYLAYINDTSANFNKVYNMICNMKLTNHQSCLIFLARISLRISHLLSVLSGFQSMTFPLPILSTILPLRKRNRRRAIKREVLDASMQILKNQRRKCTQNIIYSSTSLWGKCWHLKASKYKICVFRFKVQIKESKQLPFMFFTIFHR